MTFCLVQPLALPPLVQACGGGSAWPHLYKCWCWRSWWLDLTGATSLSVLAGSSGGCQKAAGG